MTSTLSVLKRIRQDIEDSGTVSIPRLLKDLDTAIQNEERILGQLGAVALGMRKLQATCN